MAGEILDQEKLKNMAGDIATLVCGCLPDNRSGVQVHTETLCLKSRTVVQVFASTPQGRGLFTINLQMNKLQSIV